ncbi:UDP-N-acetylmuramoylalanine--D-glutamate ligase [Elstera cyanobacteriorum]|uniref:UDP-N-acetylmuramoylalanine--D-glutamate ligase n=1 Tax=Elstera cyanobacteriorum TaxID=2022747 RepID=A0A255XKI2_9PROT|nr:UDP-N-acetylmuramoyl-L-alanine--D-glutamate ligase [Elstera cyanobacteriorum]OYQ16925.1 UDP-N-acetylmuramoyl-L-alanine--D-glutamate ligase [Elstera cyanobacteriorum]GFZ89533.1 UDP-N-acetylmuramoylalanine--D-glutamate ligase [Elstera cyanobacteriorum]
MILPTAYRNKQVAVVGLARSGLVAAQALSQAGAIVYAWDDNAPARDAALAAGLTLTPVVAMPWEQLTALILSPGIPHSYPKPHAAADAARAAGVPILVDVDLLLSTQTAAPVIAVTGTNGKSTTTALIDHILRDAGLPVAMGGNIGVPALTLPAFGPEGTYVLELSSYQLERVPSLSARTAILLNITADHLDRHGGMDGYIQAKAEIFHHQGEPDWAIIGMDDAPSRGMADKVRRADRAPRVVPISVLAPVAGGVYALDGQVIDDLDGAAVPVFALDRAPRLPGRHNAQNICAAYAAARHAGVAPDAIAEAITRFPGLAHRQEWVSTLDGVAYINDSKATNADAAERALVCYPAIHWILGGVAKAGGIDSLAAHFPRVRGAYLIGEASSTFAETLVAGGIVPKACGTLEVAVREAREAAKPGEVVLLSPACASFDQYKSFEHRGDHFRQLVENLSRTGGAE